MKRYTESKKPRIKEAFKNVGPPRPLLGSLHVKELALGLRSLPEVTLIPWWAGGLSILLYHRGPNISLNPASVYQSSTRPQHGAKFYRCAHEAAAAKEFWQQQEPVLIS